MKTILALLTAAVILFSIAMPAVAVPDPTGAAALCTGQVVHIAQYGNYALLSCDLGQTGREIAASYSPSTSTWSVVTAGGGAVDSTYLVAKGIPQDAAIYLVGAIFACPPGLRRPMPNTARNIHPLMTLCLESGPPGASPTPTPIPTPTPVKNPPDPGCKPRCLFVTPKPGPSR